MSDSAPATAEEIDWEAVKAQLEKADLAFRRTVEMHPERARATLRRRAERLAARGREGGAAVAPVAALLFDLGDESYAIALADLAEVATGVTLTSVPGTPPELLGVANLRGDIRPVLDPAAVLGIQPHRQDGGPILFLRRAGPEVGLRVDAIHRVDNLQPDRLSRPGVGEGERAAAGFVRGVSPDGVILLDTRAILGLAVLQGDDDQGRDSQGL